jgi:hypothetical protein
LSGFEIEAFFMYSESERRVIDDERRSPDLKLALALQIGFLRMTGRLLEALRMVPPALWRHLVAQFEIQVIPRERELRGYIAKAIRQHEATLIHEIVEAIDPVLLSQWKAAITQPRENGSTVQSWLWIPPAKHSTRHIDQVLERIELLASLKVDQHLAELPEAIVRRYARRLASRAPAVAARIAEPTRTIEVACFLRYCLMMSTDHLLWMVRRRVADLWRRAAEEADARKVDYARLYQQLLGEVSALAGDGTLSAAELQQKLNTVLAAHREHRGPNRAQIIT